MFSCIAENGHHSASRMLARRARVHSSLSNPWERVRRRKRDGADCRLRVHNQRADPPGLLTRNPFLGRQVGAAGAQVPRIAVVAVVLRRVGRRHVSGRAGCQTALPQAHCPNDATDTSRWINAAGKAGLTCKCRCKCK